MLVVGVLLAVAVAVGAIAFGTARSPSPTHDPGLTHNLRANSLEWQVLSIKSAPTIANAYLPTRARGLFLIVHVRETNSTERQVSVASDRLVVELGDGTYGESVSGNSALELSGRSLLPTNELAPASSVTGWASFDVPAGANLSSPRLCVEQQGAPRVCLAAPLT